MRIKSKQRLARLRKLIEKKTHHVNKLVNVVFRLKTENDELRQVILRQNVEMMALRYAAMEEGNLSPEMAGYVLSERIQKPDIKRTVTPITSIESEGPIGECENIQETCEVFEKWIRTKKPELLQVPPMPPQSKP